MKLTDPSRCVSVGRGGATMHSGKRPERCDCGGRLVYGADGPGDYPSVYCDTCTPTVTVPLERWMDGLAQATWREPRSKSGGITNGEVQTV